MKSYLAQIVLVLILTGLLVLLADPFMYWMPPLFVTLAIVAVVALMLIWLGLVAKEKGGDEREIMHRMNAGRAAYTAGLLVLTLAFVAQGLSGYIDPWISLALVAMVASKILTRIYLDKHQ